jgi:uncharacterized protein
MSVNMQTDGWPELNRAPAQSFVPMPSIRNGAVQTVLSTAKWDIPEPLRRSGMPILIDAGPDETGEEHNVRLLAYYTPRQTPGPGKGVVVLLHGWEGCSHSNYNLVTTRELANSGFDVFRLNMRDHGPGYHIHPQALNRGVFLGTLLAETVRGIARCAELLKPLPSYVVGFSMGGNFALRTAIHLDKLPVPRLRKVVAVNPAINPLWSTERIDSHPALRRYFREPWLEQLRQIQRLYPQRYDFAPLEQISSLVDMTTWLVRKSELYPDAEAYFLAYAVLGNATSDLRVPTRIITSMDDPIIPVADFYGLAPSPNLKIDMHRHGGHVGYMEGYPPAHQVGVLVRQAIESDGP